MLFSSKVHTLLKNIEQHSAAASNNVQLLHHIEMEKKVMP